MLSKQHCNRSRRASWVAEQHSNPPAGFSWGRYGEHRQCASAGNCMRACGKAAVRALRRPLPAREAAPGREGERCAPAADRAPASTCCGAPRHSIAVHAREEQPVLEHSMTVTFALTGHSQLLGWHSVVTTPQASLLGSWLAQSSSLHVRVRLVALKLPGMAAPGTRSHQEKTAVAQACADSCTCAGLPACPACPARRRMCRSARSAQRLVNSPC